MTIEYNGWKKLGIIAYSGIIVENTQQNTVETRTFFLFFGILILTLTYSLGGVLVALVLALQRMTLCYTFIF